MSGSRVMCRSAHPWPQPTTREKRVAVPPPPPLSVHQLSISYHHRPVVNELSFELGAGETVALMGPSGSGKSSILNCIVGMQLPQEGRVEIAGQPMTVPSAGSRARLRRERIGVTYQSPGLLPELDIQENVAITLLFDGVDRDEALDAARASLSSVGLDGHADKGIDQVSGGEAQRVALARALVRESAVLLVADEPTASLDSETAARMADLMVQQARARRMAALIATHDDRVAQRCDRVLDLRAVVTA